MGATSERTGGRVSIRVLVVDDEQLVRKGFRGILEAQPDIVVVQSSPLMAAPALGDMDHVLSTDYTLGFASEVAAPDPHNVYDLQDEFYLPLAGFQRIDRPGPNLKVYVRRGKEPDIASDR